MKRSLTSFVFTNGRMFLFLGVVALIAALGILPYYMTTRAQIKTGSGLFTRTESLDPDIPKMWDIREAKGEEIDNAFAKFRESNGKNAAVVADIREGFVRGEEAIKTRLPQVKIEYNNDIRIPEVITPDVWKAKVEFLSSPSTAKRSEILRNFVKQNNELIGVNDEQADALKVAADYTNPDGNLSFAHLEQLINGVPVFRGEVKAGFTKDGRIIRVINNLAPGLDYNSISNDFRDSADAVSTAFRHIKTEPRKEDRIRNEAESTDLKVKYGSGDWATTAEKMYFPTEPGVAVPAWRVLIWKPVNAYYVIVDAADGVVLWHKNITDDQTQSATYDVYRNTNAYNDFADAAAPLSPYISVPPNDPTVGAQGAMITRSNVTLIGNEGPLSFNNNGWITDNTNITDGNANEAGIDRVAPNGVDAPLPGDTACPGAGCRTFTSTWNPPPGTPPPGDDPLTPQAQRGAVTFMFYIMNRYHDELYLRGFTEQALNFQQDNFGRGGLGADRVSSEGQDSSGTNNANFATPADGGRGRMQMFLWTGPTPDRDGTGDTHIVIHEVTHGTSNRLHGNGSGLGNQGGMMGEGWGDWYAHTMTAEPTDDALGVHGLGGYSLLSLAAGFTANYYYGIRRFPTAVIASTGGPNNRPHNPLTFGHINTGCDTTLGTTTTAVSSAFPRNPVIATAGNCSQVHNAGEIWKSALWEVRNLYVTRLGFTTGTRKILDAVTNGMKVSPLNPNMLQERDAIIATALAAPLSPETTADAADVREGFRRRGFGFSASVQSATAVTEAFDAADLAGNPGTVTSGNNLLEPNECNTLNVPITNNSANPATGITAVLSSTTPGITVTQPNSAYPNIPAGGANVVNTTPFQVSTSNSIACFTQANFTLTVTYTGGAGGSPLVHNFSLPVGLAGLDYVFTQQTATIPAGGVLVAGSQVDDGTVAITLPAGWASTVYGVPVTSLSASTNGMLTVNGAAATTFTNTALPGAVGGTSPTLFPYWDDFDMDPVDTVGGGIFTNTIGTAPNRQFYVEWRATHFSETTTTPTINVAVLLTEGSDVVRYIYPLTGVGTQLNGLSATVGVQRQSTGTNLTQFSFNTSSLTPGGQITGTRPGGTCTAGPGGCAVGPVADLAITKTDGVTTVNPGQNIMYTIVASNAGPDPVTGATVTDNFPIPALTNINWTCTPANGGTCPAGGAGNINALVNLPLNGTATFTATATVSATATFGFSNTATIAVPAVPAQGLPGPAVTDPNPANNSARDTDVICNTTPTRTTFSNNTPVAIPTGPGVVTSTIVVAGAGASIYDLNMTTNMNHTFAADLDVTLTSPAGTVVTLTTDNGAGNDNVFGGTVWDDDANPGGTVPYVTNNGLATDHAYVNLTPATPLAPEEAFGAFIGENPNGTWTITISDDLTGDGGSLDSWSLDVGTFPAAPITTVVPTVTNNTPVAIPTGPGVVTSTIVVAGAGTSIYDLNMTTNMNHTFAADLDVTLTSPAGTVVTLTTDNGAGNDNVFGGTVWDDDANPGGTVPYVTNNGLATDHAYVNLTPATPLAPEEAFAAFIGENPNGTWTITISDDLTGDGGSLDSWSLNITTATFSCTTTAAGVPVSGRVTTPDGYGLRNATVTITDSTGMARSTRTTTFGYFRFDGIEVGGTYVVSVGSRRYTFTPRTITVNDAVTDLDFIGNGSE